MKKSDLDIPWQCAEPVLMVGGGEVAPQQLKNLGKNLPIIATDSGADIVAEAGFRPYLVAGDFDSISSVESFPDSHLIKMPSQDSTDFSKTLGLVESPLIIGLGFLGRRFDHSLASINSLARAYPKSVLLMDKYDVLFFTKKSVALNLSCGGDRDRVSVLPMGAQGFISSKGLKWSLSGLELRLKEQIGTSNQVSAKDGKIEINPSDKGDGYLVILEAKNFLAVAEFLAPNYVSQLSP